jgi:DNA-binding transcriptional MerR regulator
VSEVKQMWIGELSERTGTARRLLRYYEEQGLISASRAANGYREYDGEVVDRVTQIRGLLDAGLPTGLIKDILPCLYEPEARYCPTTSPEIIARLERERDRMTRRIEFLTRNRDAITNYLGAIPVPDGERGRAVRA